ncbi:MAG TPA: glycosyltransferase family 2 protein [Gemmatimonadales bacterium]
MPSPYPELPLPIRVTELEIAGGIPDLHQCHGYGGVYLLLRRHGDPLGSVTLPVSEDTVRAAAIEAAMHRKLSRQNGRAVLLDSQGAVPRHPPEISVVVCTRDRPRFLERCLQSLAQLQYPTYEVIVVDNASISEATRQLAQKAGVRYVREERPGLDWARNCGYKAARHGIVAYTDDDTEVDPKWLAAIGAAFVDPAVRAVSGLVLPAAMDTEAELLFEFCYGGMGKGTISQEWDPASLSASQRIGAHHVGVGANMAFRRDLLQELGGFDTALDVGTPSHGGGDLDIFHRTLMAGAVIRYQPAALVRHHHRKDMLGLRRQFTDNGRAFGVYLLTIFSRGSIPRHSTVWYSIRIWLAWLLGRIVKRFARRELLPLPMLLAELWGAAQSPFAFFATYREDSRRRSLYSTPPHGKN